MIKKQFVKSRKVTKVTFELPADVEADAVQLIADWSDWQPVPFDHLKSGKWKLVQELEPEQDYQFRYRVVSGSEDQYLNDPEADYTVPNDRGTENAVLRA
ncbi:MAG: isoamylase early set domain-containing protein [Trueperaceae bacterium]|nr:MAG: isoamylase early set domain-containing protein [Trueperaceae bacterium]